MKLESHVAAHVHNDVLISAARVDAFGSDAREVQLEVLCVLRLRANDKSNDTQIALLAVGIAVVGLFISPTKIAGLTGIPLWASLIVGAVLGVVGVVVAIPFLIRPMIRSAQHEHASVWLPAFEEELARRRAWTGRRARKWQESH